MRIIFFAIRATIILAVLVPVLLFVTGNIPDTFKDISQIVFGILPTELSIPLYLILGYSVYAFITSFLPE